jgi:hypothetical protein
MARFLGREAVWKLRGSYYSRVAAGESTEELQEIAAGHVTRCPTNLAQNFTKSLLFS